MKINLKKPLIALAAMATAVPGIASAGAIYSYTYLDCQFGDCQLITCTVFETDPFSSTSQTFEICSPSLGGGGGPGGS